MTWSRIDRAGHLDIIRSICQSSLICILVDRCAFASTVSGLCKASALAFPTLPSRCNLLQHEIDYALGD